ncbi:hypothetical protein Tcan_10177 [Toxocara canis]|uniref:Uncharacterized protein n=1 Tax=Toxocara canis TaxID=6265 RepID=A0A0B2V2A0_TOXCA|nr:hypothetical protein Tcan_10177 [Toxocara canis]
MVLKGGKVFPEATAGHKVLLVGSPLHLVKSEQFEYECEPGPSSSLRQRSVAYHRLSSSVGEVQIQSDLEDGSRLSLKTERLGESLESTHSLTYLERVHERQTRRLRTRSEWFLSPALPAMSGLSSKSVDFDYHLASVSMHRVTFDDDYMSSTQDMADIQPTLSSSSHFTPLNQPLRPLGQASACTSTPKGVLPLSEGAMTKSSRGVLRRRSWRTHYVRPSKALDESTPGRNEDESSRSVPLHRCYVASVQSVSMPCSRQVSGGAIALSHAESSPSSQTVTNSIPGMDEGDAKKSSTQAKFVHF